MANTHILARAQKALNRKASLAGIILVIGVCLGGVLLWQFANAERDRDRQQWQIRMELVAKNQAKEVRNWVDKQFELLEQLSNNQSLQLYIMELQSGNTIATAGVEPAEAVYLRNLISVSAQRGGFHIPSVLEEVNANIEHPKGAGIALLNMDFSSIVSTKAMPPIEDNLLEFLQTMEPGRNALLDIYLADGGVPTMAFAVPIYSVQGGPETDSQIAIALGVKSIADELYPLLASPHISYDTGESLLIRTDSGAVQYLSPLMNGKKPLSLQLALTTPENASAHVVDNPGSFSVKRDYRFQKVFALGERVSGTPWTIIHKIDRNEAMADSDARIERLIGIFVLAALVALAALIAAWRHGSSLQSERAAIRYKNLYQRFKSQEQLLRLVSDNQPDAMYLLDDEGRFLYANHKAAKDARIDGRFIAGKSLEDILGTTRAKEYRELNMMAIKQQHVLTHLLDVNSRMVQSQHVPVDLISRDLDKENMKGVLVVEQDITELVREREKKEHATNELINTLLRLVDLQDPFAADHSSRVSKIARAVAEEMELDEVMIKTTEMAGKLMNIGKLLIPKDILTKAEDLSEQERQDIKQSIYIGADFLQTIPFEGPVVETLKQCQENWDGSGLEGLKGEDIIVSARIIGAVNTFIALVSPRAYRHAKTKDEALEIMLADVGTKYQRSVIAALVNYMDNHANIEDFVSKVPDKS